MIERHFGVKYHPGHVWYLLRNLRWSLQKPDRRARERDEGAITAWRDETWSQVKKASDHGWSIVLIDESGFMRQPVARRTWPPRGQTPIQYSWDRRDRLSAISAITIAPQRRRLGLYFQIHEANICTEQVIAFLSLLQAAHPDWFEVEWLPPYAPDLKPVEMVWNHTKYGDLANFIPDDIHHLRQAVTHTERRAEPAG